MVLRCYMPGCTNKGRFGFHKFPRNKEMCMKWLCISKRRNLNANNLPSQLRLCQKHFKQNDSLNCCNENRRLKKTAVPSVYIPEETSVYEEHSYIQWSFSQPKV